MRQAERARQQRHEWPPLTTTAEYQAEARSETPIIRLFGLRDSAVLNPEIINRRFKRHCEYFGVTAWKLKATLVTAVILVSVVLAGTVFVYNVGQVETRSMGANPFGQAAIALVGAVVFSTGLAGAYFLIQKWQRAYTTVWVYETNDPVEAWRTTGVLHCFLPRLGFVDAREGDYYSGPTRASGPQQGMVHLDLDEGKRIVDMDNIAECYGLPASKSTFTEVPAREAYDLLETAAEAGTLKRGIGRSKAAKLFQENWAWILTLVEGVMMFFMATGGGGQV